MIRPQTSDDTSCVCSLDRMGNTCNDWRPYTCNVTLVTPKPQCQSSILDADPICFLFSRKQKVEFAYNIHCAFSNTANIAVAFPPPPLLGPPKRWGVKRNDWPNETLIMFIFQVCNQHSAAATVDVAWRVVRVWFQQIGEQRRLHLRAIIAFSILFRRTGRLRSGFCPIWGSLLCRRSPLFWSW